MVTMIMFIRTRPLGRIIPDNGRVYVVLQNVVVSCSWEGLAHSKTLDLNLHTNHCGVRVRFDGVSSLRELPPLLSTWIKADFDLYSSQPRSHIGLLR